MEARAPRWVLGSIPPATKVTSCSWGSKATSTASIRRVARPKVVPGPVRVEERFTVDTMVRGYLDVYAEVLERWPSRRGRTASDRAEVARWQAATPSGSE